MNEVRWDRYCDKMCPKYLAIGIILIATLPQNPAITLSNGDVALELDVSTNGINLNLTLNGEEKLLGTIGTDRKLMVTTDCDSTSSCFFTGSDYKLTITGIDSGFNISWLTYTTGAQFQDCFTLQRSKVSWFGGPEMYTSEWPIENLVIPDLAYRSSRLQNGAVAERYWLSSKGTYIFVQDKVPLFLDQNNVEWGSMCLIAKVKDPYFGRERVLLEYSIVAKSDAKEAHLHAVDNYLGKPSGHPNEWIIRKPIWTTWAKYKREISDQVVLDFAKDIKDHGFTGQLEIDEAWETCFGTATFNDKFTNINATVKALKSLGFTVTLWTHPFVNDDCIETTSFAREKGYFVVNTTKSDFTYWWEGSNGHHIDFTNEDAKQWFVDRRKKLLQDYGIDSFKFDAGETDWAPNMAELSGDPEEAPNSLTQEYIRACATFGDLIEVRSSWRTQDLPIFVRMQDKDSRWGLDNGLHNLITTLLQMNLNGYTMVLPDMIGGNGYGNDFPTAEILARWTQANAFMPAMQFSFLPWEINSTEFDGLAIVKKYVALHEKYADAILVAMKASIANGIPVNPPIWWVDPTNPDALTNNDQFLLGETILVAPVITKGATARDVVITKGVWRDANNNDVYQGPTIIKNYPAPIDVLPFFIRDQSAEVAVI